MLSTRTRRHAQPPAKQRQPAKHEFAAARLRHARAEAAARQVCALQWSIHEKELVSSHGFSHNQLILWKVPSMVKVAELTGHTSRVLHMAQSPDGTTVVSAAADETLRFWKILGADAQGRRGESESVLSPAAVAGASPSAWTVR